MKNMMSNLIFENVRSDNKVDEMRNVQSWVWTNPFWC